MPRQTNGDGDTLAAFAERGREFIEALERTWDTLPPEERRRYLALIEGMVEGPADFEEEEEEDADAEGPFWLQAQLDARHWSVRRFGRLIGCTAAHAHYLARGEKGPGPELARRMAEVLGVTEQTILRAYGKLSPLPDDWDEQQERQLVELWRGLERDARAQVMQFARFLAGEG